MDNIHIEQPDAIDLKLENTSLSGAGRHNISLAGQPVFDGQMKVAAPSTSWAQSTMGQIVIGVLVIVVGSGLLAGFSVFF